MPDRNTLAAAFVESAGWSGARRQPLAGDASGRSYERLCRGGQDCVVLMDAGPSGHESLGPFVRIAAHLNGIGLSAPQILAADFPNGFLLLEDFGDRVFASQMAANPAADRPLYEAAVDALCHLRQAPLPGQVSGFSAADLAEFAALTYDWYLPVPEGAAAGAFKAELTRLLASISDCRPALALRDFHSENMIWLPERLGIRRVGLLDFQDAFLCHPAYDLVSMLRDARRDLSPGLGQMLLDRYIQGSQCDRDELALAIAIYGAQRNLRILGVFARLSRSHGKPHYVELIPRVWRHLMTDLAHPVLYNLRRITLSDLPEPTPDHLTLLKAKCTTPPVP